MYIYTHISINPSIYVHIFGLGSPQSPTRAPMFSRSDPILSSSAPSCPVQADLLRSNPAWFSLSCLSLLLSSPAPSCPVWSFTPLGRILPGSV